MKDYQESVPVVYSRMYTKTSRRSERASVPESKPPITSKSPVKKHNNLLPPTDFAAKIFKCLSG